jgi:hypothetical protein
LHPDRIVGTPPVNDIEIDQLAAIYPGILSLTQKENGWISATYDWQKNPENPDIAIDEEDAPAQ